MLNACVAILVAGAACQWLAWRLKVPVILLLLVTGFTAGPLLGWLDPDELFGPILMPTISLAAAVVLFEGGLGMPWHRLRRLGRSVYALVTVGAAITGVTLAFAAHELLNMSWGAAAMLGAILVVTGPTVIGPLMRHVRPTRAMKHILEYEGVIIDPIGAIAAVLVFEVVAHQGVAEEIALAGLGRAVGAGVVFGVVGALLIELLQRTAQLPQFLRGGVSLAAALGAYAAANWIQGEAGLLAVTVMGAVLASRRKVKTETLVSLNEHLVVLLVSFLFIVLAARVEMNALLAIPAGGWLFVLCVFLVRPVSVFAASIGSGHTLKERLFLSFVAPRGIVAAAMASVFGVALVADDIAGAELVMPLTFLTVVMTVLVYGLAARPLAQWLGLAQSKPRSVLVFGAGVVGRAIALAIQRSGVEVRLVDPDIGNCDAARQLHLPVQHGFPLDEDTRETLFLDEVRTLIVASEDPAANVLVVNRLEDEVSQVLYVRDGAPEADRTGTPMSGLDHRALAAALESGATIHRSSSEGQILFKLDDSSPFRIQACA